ncbi:hypothetical protein Q3O60_12640 [Alkalimonas collagenimarina]|uniref:Uncharacterized protein n=1 Tax=Alkalimonas collagenimarina TaxID=400390 RepID=A0ABT9H161_9GAMM|nr:hypothetical protein [Alkalimonas collagenimarina]MDP4537041.1 hypothetical protein [Alkalimonas collagenimarina]
MATKVTTAAEAATNNNKDSTPPIHGYRFVYLASYTPNLQV